MDMIASWVDLPAASDQISVIGLLLTLAGLAGTAAVAWRAKSAARLAEQAARAASEQVFRTQESVQIEVAIYRIEEILTLATSNKRYVIPEKLIALIGVLDGIRDGGHFRKTETGVQIQDFIMDLSAIHKAMSSRDYEGTLRTAGPPAPEDVKEFQGQHETFVCVRSFLRTLENEIKWGRDHAGH